MPETARNGRVSSLNRNVRPGFLVPRGRRAGNEGALPGGGAIQRSTMTA